MYTHEFLMDAARAHGWDGGEETLPLYLPFGIVRALGDAHPYHKHLIKVARQLRIERSVLNWMFMFENDRAFNDVLMERIYVSQPDGEGEGEGQPQAQPQVASDEYGEGEGEQDGDNQEQQGQQEGKGNRPDYGEGQGEGQGQPQPRPSVPKSQRQPSKAGQTPKQQQKSLNQWLKSMRGEQKKQEKQRSMQMQSNHNYGQSFENSIGDIKIANRLRSYYEQIVGAFDQLITPRYDTSKVVKRMISHLSLDPARKWEDGRPDMCILTDTSGSCESVSAAITLAANSASMLGTPQGRIISLPFMNNYLEHSSYGYLNGKALGSIGGGESGRAGGELIEELGRLYNKAANGEKNVVGLLQDMLVKHGGMSSRDVEILARGASIGWLWEWLQSAVLVKELGGKFEAHTPGYAPDNKAYYGIAFSGNHNDAKSRRLQAERYATSPVAQAGVRKIQEATGLRPLVMGKDDKEFEVLQSRADKAAYEGEIAAFNAMNAPQKHENTGKSYEAHMCASKQHATMHAAGMSRVLSRELMDIALLVSLDCAYYIYYTDHDGVPAMLSLAALLKPHQHLYVLTYGIIPNMQVKNPSSWMAGTPDLDSGWVRDVRAQLISAKGWASRAHNKAGFHTAGGHYGHPALTSKKVGISIPANAYRPQHYGDVTWLPSWFNNYGWSELMGAKGMENITVMPNVDGVEGALDALRLIASPDRMAMAVEGGRKTRVELEKQNLWGGNSNNSPVNWCGSLRSTPFDVT